MKMMSVRDLRQRWPAAEKALAAEGEIVVTRDSKPVARILPFKLRDSRPRKRFDAETHLRWMARFWRGRRLPPIDAELAGDRADSD
ncbi:MAG: hypothetical protein AB1714_15085 [Acidobacteriota bacterium]